MCPVVGVHPNGVRLAIGDPVARPVRHSDRYSCFSRVFCCSVGVNRVMVFSRERCGNMTLLRALSSDWLKTKKTAISYSALRRPLFCFRWQLSGISATFAKIQQLQYNIHEAFFQVGTIFLPMAAGLFAGLLCAQEEHAGNFIGMIAEPVSRLADLSEQAVASVPAADRLDFWLYRASAAGNEVRPAY